MQENWHEVEDCNCWMAKRHQNARWSILAPNSNTHFLPSNYPKPTPFFQCNVFEVFNTVTITPVRPKCRLGICFMELQHSVQNFLVTRDFHFHTKRHLVSCSLEIGDFWVTLLIIWWTSLVLSNVHVIPSQICCYFATFLSILIKYMSYFIGLVLDSFYFIWFLSSQFHFSPIYAQSYLLPEPVVFDMLST